MHRRQGSTDPEACPPLPLQKGWGPARTFLSQSRAPFPPPHRIPKKKKLIITSHHHHPSTPSSSPVAIEGQVTVGLIVFLLLFLLPFQRPFALAGIVCLTATRCAFVDFPLANKAPPSPPGLTSILPPLLPRISNRSSRLVTLTLLRAFESLFFSIQRRPVVYTGLPLLTPGPTVRAQLNRRDKLASSIPTPRNTNPLLSIQPLTAHSTA